MCFLFFIIDYVPADIIADHVPSDIISENFRNADIENDK